MNQDYKENRATALRLTYGRILGLFQKNKEILEKHLTLANREKLESLKDIIRVPDHATLTEIMGILTSIFRVINKPDERMECERLSRYLIGWRFEEDPRK